MRNYFKSLVIQINMLILICLVGVSCSSSGQNSSGQITVNQSESNIGDNLDLRALGEIVKSSSTPEEIEKKLNADAGINNLDLDGDSKTDYLKVTEYGQGSEHGYSVCAVLKDGEPEVANVVVNTQSQQMTLNGSPSYYGNSHNTYQTGITPSEMLLWMYLMRPHYTYYHSPYYYGHYGYGYSYRPIVPYHSYRTRTIVHTSTTRTYTRPTTRSTTSVRSPNVNNQSKAAAQRTSNFNNASRSQKSFKTTSPSAGPRNTSGFGNKPSSSEPRKSGGFGSSTPSSSKNYSTPSRSSSPSKSSGFGSSSKSSSGSSSRSGKR